MGASQKTMHQIFLRLQLEASPCASLILSLCMTVGSHGDTPGPWGQKNESASTWLGAIFSLKLQLFP